MALHQNEHQTHHQQQQQQNPLLLLDCLYCEEEKWEDEQEQQEQNYELQLEESILDDDDNGRKECFSFLLEAISLLDDDQELDSLFSKEQENQQTSDLIEIDRIHLLARTEAVEWILKVNAHYGFQSLTALLAINYLDRVLSGPHFQRDKPWMVQLLAVTCISLAAKVEEIQVPLLLDLQVEDSKYYFEAKTIQRMELLVLTALQWKMHPVTPVSFLDLIIRRFGLRTQIQMEFFWRCDRILLSLASDSRSVSYLPSVLAISTMATVIEQMGNCNSIDFLDRLLKSLNINKERVNECCNLILELSKSNTKADHKNHGKRKNEERSEVPESPNGVIDASFSSDNSNDSWAVVGTKLSEEEEEEDYYYSPHSKRSRGRDQPPMILPSLINRVFVDLVTNPP